MDRNYLILVATAMFVGIKTADALGRGVAFAIIGAVMLGYLVLEGFARLATRNNGNG